MTEAEQGEDVGVRLGGDSVASCKMWNWSGLVEEAVLGAPKEGRVCQVREAGRGEELCVCGSL